jgi:hypothetical protein
MRTWIIGASASLCAVLVLSGSAAAARWEHAKTQLEYESYGCATGDTPATKIIGNATVKRSGDKFRVKLNITHGIPGHWYELFFATTGSQTDRREDCEVGRLGDGKSVLMNEAGKAKFNFEFSMAPATMTEFFVDVFDATERRTHATPWLLLPPN